MPGSRRTIALVCFDGVQSLDIVGPMEVFSKANQYRRAQDPEYEILLASPDGGEVVSNSGLAIGRLVPIDDLPTELDTIVIAGGSEQGLRKAVFETKLVTWLKSRAKNTRRVSSVCTGAFVLAAAGLLDGRRATTHWNSCDLLKNMFPAVEIDPDAIFVAAPPVYTSAGITSGIDLCLMFVESDCGAAAAVAVARDLVLFMRRPGGQAQFSTTLKTQTAATPGINKLLVELSDNPRGDLSVSALAERMHMSERTFLRTFRKETGTTPSRFVQRLRVDHAKALLETTTWPLARIAEHAGFRSLDSLHRAFSQLVKTTPTTYRLRFGLCRSRKQG